ncbi:MAG: glycoside hydrolase family 31 protein, partial [Chitinophagaceae bacterium]|nr:glycoside hydrolase family 31 protein [Chitinophagaceae bacterium]
MRSWFCFLLAALLCTNTYAQLDVKVENKKIDLVRNGSSLITIDSISINFIAQHFQEVVYRGDDSIMLKVDYPLMPDFNRLETGFDHSLELGISFRNNTFHFSGHGDWIGNITIHMTDKNDHFFGLQETLYPDNKKSPDLRGSVIDVEVNGEQYRYKENFASAWSAFYFNPKGYASFMNTFAKGRYQLAINGQTSITHETNTLDWYIFTGNHNDIYQQYYSVIGEPKKVPVWSCGPIVWRDENKGGAPEIVDDAKQFLKLKIPLTGLMVDRPYSNGSNLWSKMDFNEQFKNPGKWIKQLKDSTGLYFLTWIAPATFSDTDFPGRLSGSFNYIDLTDPAAITEFAKRLNKNQYAYGVKGHKMDRADEQFPEMEPWFDKTPRQERKNKYAFLYAKVTDSILRSHLGNDQLNYARAAYHGSQHYLSGIWGGDPRSTWDGMAGNLANSMRASYMGFSNWGTDVGGYLGQSGKIAEDLYIRWLQWGVFNGIYEIKIDGAGGAGEDRAPWHSSKKLQDAFRKACEMRMDLLPHIYSQLNTAGTYGTLMKPLGMVYPDDPTVYNIWDEYIFGNALLVAPVLAEGNSRRVYLPEGSWINYYTGEKLTGKKHITADATNGIPVFIKSNSIIARGNIYEGNTALWKSSDKYVDFYYYPGEGNTSMDFVDAQDNSKRYKIQTATDYKMPAINIPAISYNGYVKIYADKLP